jgi:hypothetical protein
MATNSGLSNFEDADDTDLTELLSTTKRHTEIPQAPRLRTAPEVNEDPEDEPDAPDEPVTEVKTRSKGKKTSSKKSTPAARSDRENEIKSSSVHIPTALFEPLKAYRTAKGMSNGQVIIAAIEATHTDLADLIHPATAGGGGLFAQRTTKGVRTTDGPLAPLNVRLFEQDYKVIDRLVEEFSAYSRGHLVTVALTEFLKNQ